MMKNTKRIVVALSIIAIGIFLLNYFTLSKPLSEVLNSDSRNSGIKIHAYYKYYIYPTVLVINIQNVSNEKSEADVFRVFLQFASKLKEKSFNEVLLKSKGETKFILNGDYFKTLGTEYKWQNPIYTIRTFTEHVYIPDGKRAFGTWTGGFFGVVNKQMEDFHKFNTKWYIEDI